MSIQGGFSVWVTARIWFRRDAEMERSTFSGFTVTIPSMESYTMRQVIVHPLCRKLNPFFSPPAKNSHHFTRLV